MLGRTAGSAAVVAALCVALFASPDAGAIPWPGETWSAAVDLTPLEPSDWSSNLSGAYWNSDTRRLWVCINGPLAPDSRAFWSLREDGLGSFVVEREYAGTGDLEGITQASTVPDLVFLLDEQGRTIRSYSVSTGAAGTSWFLSSIPNWGNSGPEGIAFVPDAWLAANNFVDGSGNPYPQSVHGANGYGGIFFIAVQTSGWVYVVDLRNDGTSTYVGRYQTSRTESCEMTFDPSIGKMYILHNIDGNLLEITNLTSFVSGTDRKFNTYVEVQVPSGSNIEGFALTPALTATSTVGDNWCFFTDDNCASGALRWFRQLRPTLQKQAGDGQTAEIDTNVPIAPAVLASDAFTNPLPGFSIAYAVASGGGSVTGANATTNSSGIAAVGSWRLGPLPGANSLTATGTGLTGSPQTFTATGQDTTPPTVTINQQGAQPDPTNALPISYDVVFSEAVTGFAAADIAQSGTAAGVTFAVTAVDASHYTVRATAATGDGTVQPTIAAGRCVDVGGNGNTASTSADNTVTLDRQPPTAAIVLDDPTPTALDAVHFGVDFNEAVGATFNAGDVTLTGTLAGVATFGVSGADPNYTVTVTMNSPEDDGTIGIQIGTGVTDPAGNSYAGGVSGLYRIHNWHGFTLQPAGANVYVGANWTFTVAASFGNSIPVYQWRFDNGTTVQNVGSNSPAYAIAGAALNQAGDYWCEIAYDGSTYPSNPATLAVADHVSIAPQPVGGSAYVGDAFMFTVGALGGFTPYTYQWRKNGTDIAGATSSALSFGSLVTGNAGTYSCRVRDALTDNLLSNNAVLRVAAPLTIATQPAGANRAVGGSHTFTVAATGGYTPYTYQWRKNGTIIAGATSTAFTRNPLIAGDQASYDCVVTDNLGTGMSVASNTAMLRVLAIQTQPTSQAVGVGQSVTFSVVVLPGSGNSPYTYQWRKNGTNIVGATLSAYTIGATFTSDAANYYVLVGQTAGDSLFSSVAVLMVEAPPMCISTQPVGGSFYVGGAHTLTVVVSSGYPPLAYQWRKNGTNIAGATLSSLAFASLATTDDADYLCRIADGSLPIPQMLDSATVHVYVRAAVSVATQPVGGNRAEGGSHTFTVVGAGGYPPLAYQWRKNGTNIAGATLTTLTRNPLVAGDQASYDCVVTDKSGTGMSVASNIAVLRVLAIQTQPVSRAVGEGSPVTFSVVVLPGSGNSPYTYQWRKNGTNIAGATLSGYTITDTYPTDSGNYTVMIGQMAGDSLLSNNATLFVDGALMIFVAQPVGGSKYVSDTHTFSVVVSGGVTPLYYQWRKNGTDIAGATSSTYAIASLLSTDDADYSCLIHDSHMQYLSSMTVHLYVRETLTIVTQPQSQAAYTGSPVTLSVAATGGYTPLMYQWRRNGTDSAGATLISLSFASVATTDAGTYACHVQDALTGDALSDAAVLQVADHIAIATHPQPLSVTEGQPATFAVTTTGGIGPISYQWREDGGDITGATLDTYTIPNTVLLDAADYSCAATDENNNETVVSNEAALTVTPGLPAAGALGLTTLAAACAAWAIRRAKRRPVQT